MENPVIFPSNQYIDKMDDWGYPYDETETTGWINSLDQHYTEPTPASLEERCIVVRHFRPKWSAVALKMGESNEIQMFDVQNLNF